MKRKILIVEDEAVTSVMLEKTLNELGYDVVGSAFDGEEALELAKEKRPDLALMDIRIQGDMDGIETARQMYQLYDVPIIYLTAHSDDDTIKRAVESGPFGYLIKPFKERELYSNIEMTIHKHKLFHPDRTPGQVPVPVPEPEPEEAPPEEEKAPVRPILKMSDYRLAVLAIQSLPHPVILFNTAGNILFLNNACKGFLKLTARKKPEKGIQTIEDLPDLVRKIWDAGKEKFNEGKGFSISGPLTIRGAQRRFKIDMVPLFDRENLQFISTIIVRESGREISYGDDIDGVINILDDAERKIREIQFLSSPEDTYRFRQISVHTTELLKKIEEVRTISFPKT